MLGCSPLSPIYINNLIRLLFSDGPIIVLNINL